VASFEATARYAGTLVEVEVAELAVGARRRARELWYASPTHAHARAIGMSSWEGLWCRFESEGMEELRAFGPGYRRGAWAAALRDQGVDDEALAEELGERYGVERRARSWLVDGAEEVVTALAARGPLGLITNGASCLQREKLAMSGLAEHFAAVVVSGDLGVGKPDPRIFRAALDALGAEHALMVGDNLERDVRGALALGLDAVWFSDEPAPDRIRAIRSLRELLA
jgi:HAD superfamily hydrolase (TIGR01549 family)